MSEGKGKSAQRGIDESAVELATLLTQVFHTAKRRGGPPGPELQEAAERERLGPRHAPVLFAVALEEGLSISELSRRVGLSVPTTSLLVGELSRAGLVARSEDERDRRRTIVTIPADLQDSVGAWVRQVVAPMRATLERLSPQVREAFMEGVRVLAEESERSAPDGGDGACEEAA